MVAAQIIRFDAQPLDDTMAALPVGGEVLGRGQPIPSAEGRLDSLDELALGAEGKPLSELVQSDTAPALRCYGDQRIPLVSHRIGDGIDCCGRDGRG